MEMWDMTVNWTPEFTSEQIANANYNRLVELCVEDRTSQ